MPRFINVALRNFDHDEITAHVQKCAHILGLDDPAVARDFIYMVMNNIHGAG